MQQRLGVYEARLSLGYTFDPNNPPSRYIPFRNTIATTTQGCFTTSGSTKQPRGHLAECCRVGWTETDGADSPLCEIRYRAVSLFAQEERRCQEQRRGIRKSEITLREGRRDPGGGARGKWRRSDLIIPSIARLRELAASAKQWRDGANFNGRTRRRRTANFARASRTPRQIVRTRADELICFRGRAKTKPRLIRRGKSSQAPCFRR